MCNKPGFNSTSQKIKKYVSDKLFSLFENHEKRIIVIQIKIYVHVYLPKSYGQSSLVPKTKSRPRICETSTPEVMASWLKTPANPLNEVGAISERYRGAAPEFIPAKENLKRLMRIDNVENLMLLKIKSESLNMCLAGHRHSVVVLHTKDNQIIKGEIMK